MWLPDSLRVRQTVGAATDESARHIRWCRCELLHDRDERRKDAERLVEQACAHQTESERRYKALARTVAMLAEGEGDPSDDDALIRELRAAKRQIATAQDAVRQAMQFARSHKDAWRRLSEIIHETRNIAQI